MALSSCSYFDPLQLCTVHTHITLSLSRYSCPEKETVTDDNDERQELTKIDALLREASTSDAAMDRDEEQQEENTDAILNVT